MRSIEAATLSRVIAFVTLVERNEGMGPAMTAELGGLISDRHGIPALLGMAQLDPPNMTARQAALAVWDFYTGRGAA